MTPNEHGAAARQLKQPHGLSPRVQWLRDYYFMGTARPWNNEFTCFTTGTPWDVVYDELTYLIVPETYGFMQPFRCSSQLAAHPVDVPDDFYDRSIPERRAWFIREVMVEHLPQEILPGDLLAGGRFNVLASRCFTRREARQRDRRVVGRRGVRRAVQEFHDRGYGNAGATSGHLIPGHERALTEGFAGIHARVTQRLDALSVEERRGPQGQQLRAMQLAATMPRDLASRYAEVCDELAGDEPDTVRRAELRQMAANLRRVPWQPPCTFWEAVQALWLTHMLIMSDENYPGPGVSFGRVDQYLLPYWERSLEAGMDREFGKEILRCFWMHANTAYDAMIRVGANQGITSGYGQLITLSGLGPDGQDMTNDLTLAMLEVIDELSPILEPKPNVRLHRNSPDELLERVVEMVASSQGAPFLLNFDERSMAGLMRQASKLGQQQWINARTVHDYSPVGCLENTMVGNDRSGTVDCNLNLLKAVELALTGGKDLLEARDPITGKAYPIRQHGPRTGDATRFATFEQFWKAFAAQTGYIVQRCVDLYEMSESVRAEFCPTPYLSLLVDGCIDKALDITRGGAELSTVTGRRCDLRHHGGTHCWRSRRWCSTSGAAPWRS